MSKLLGMFSVRNAAEPQNRRSTRQLQRVNPKTHNVGTHTRHTMHIAAAHTHQWDAWVPSFRLNTPLGYEANHIPKESLAPTTKGFQTFGQAVRQLASVGDFF